MGLHFAPWNRNDIVEDMAFLDIRMHTHKLDMLRAFCKTSTVFSDLLQADTCPFGGTNSSFAPLQRPISLERYSEYPIYRSIDQFVPISRILIDLLDFPRSRALKRHDV